MKTMTITKNTSIILIAVIAAVMISSALAVTVTTSPVLAKKGSGSSGSSGSSGVNDGSPGNSDFGHSHGPARDATCNPSTVGNQTATLNEGTCTASLFSNSEPQKDTFQQECLSILHSSFVHETDGELNCIFPAT
jgi:hypothetical protein